MQEYVGFGLIILGVIAGLTNWFFKGKIIYHGVSIPISIVLIIGGAKIAGWW